MKGFLLVATILVIFFAGYLFMRRLDKRMVEGHKRRQKLKNNKLISGDDDA